MLGDKCRLQQVFWNILTNAVKFTPNNGRIVVTLHNQDGRLLVDVEDNGKGIEPEFLPYVFERFRQEDGSKTRRYGGLGLGLAIVRHIVEAHGGTVHVESAGKNLGAKFTVCLLPLKAEERDAPSPPCDATQDQQTGKANPFHSEILSGRLILVIEDQKDARELIRRALNHSGARVMDAASGKEALAKLANTRPDLIICDIGLPDEDGYTLLRRIRQKIDPELKIPTIALTAYVRDEDRHQAFAATFDMHLGKPVRPSELIQSTSTLLLKANVLRRPSLPPRTSQRGYHPEPPASQI